MASMVIGGGDVQFGKYSLAEIAKKQENQAKVIGELSDRVSKIEKILKENNLNVE